MKCVQQTGVGNDLSSAGGTALQAAETLWVDIDGGSRSLGYDFKSHTGSLVFFLSLLTVCMS